MFCIQKILEDATISLQEVYNDIRSYADIFEFSPENLDALQNRMEIIYQLKRKYGDSVEKILKHLQKVRAEIAAIENFDSDIENLQKDNNISYKISQGKVVYLT